MKKSKENSIKNQDVSHDDIRLQYTEISNSNSFFGQINEKNELHGIGIMIIKESTQSEIYIGNFYHGKMNGFGIIYINNNLNFIGFHKDNMKDGFGIEPRIVSSRMSDFEIKYYENGELNPSKSIKFDEKNIQYELISDLSINLEILVDHKY